MNTEDEQKEVAAPEAEAPVEAAPAEETAAPAAEESSAPAEETAAAEPEKNDPQKSGDEYVDEAYKCFIKDAVELEPTNPVKAVKAHFEKNATPELKEQVKKEGKTAEGAWKFMEAVARKVGNNCHIDPSAVYAIVMHYFQDVPAMADFEPALEKEEKAKRASEVRKKIAEDVAKDKVEKKKKAKEKTKATKAAKKVADKPSSEGINPKGTAKCPCETCETCADDGTCQNKESPTTYGHANPSLVYCPKAKPKSDNSSKLDEEIIDLMVENLPKSNTREDFRNAISKLTGKQKSEYFKLLLAEFVKGEKEDVTEAVEARQQFEFKNKIDYKAADGGERVQYPSVKKLEEAGQKAAEAVSKKDKPAAKPVKRSAAETEKANGQLFLI